MANAKIVAFFFVLLTMGCLLSDVNGGRTVTTGGPEKCLFGIGKCLNEGDCETRCAVQTIVLVKARGYCGSPVSPGSLRLCYCEYDC
ncbi:hypothetical protein M569_02768 [Genlisea aurea]|uniref:Defensin-like protein n=1 Tax=Genlisea aurea TaxID=192259 RepID=S8D3L4_9LAMI|nr:hypothetical protein M569_02768 [Genlisea aurea]